MEKENLSTNIKVSSDNKAGWEHKFLLKMIVFLLILLPLPSSRRMTATERKVNSRVSSHYQFLPFFFVRIVSRSFCVICKRAFSAFSPVHFIDFLLSFRYENFSFPFFNHSMNLDFFPSSRLHNNGN